MPNWERRKTKRWNCWLAVSQIDFGKRFRPARISAQSNAVIQAGGFESDPVRAVSAPIRATLAASHH
jgi:hypothetical protein